MYLPQKVILMNYVGRTGVVFRIFGFAVKFGTSISDHLCVVGQLCES